MLLECQECGAQVSDKAISCPKCGAPPEEHLDINSKSSTEPSKEIHEGIARAELDAQDMQARTFWVGIVLVILIILILPKLSIFQEITKQIEQMGVDLMMELFEISGGSFTEIIKLVAAFGVIIFVFSVVMTLLQFVINFEIRGCRGYEAKAFSDVMDFTKESGFYSNFVELKFDVPKNFKSDSNGWLEGKKFHFKWQNSSAALTVLILTVVVGFIKNLLT